MRASLVYPLLTSIVIVPAVCTVRSGISIRPAALKSALGRCSTGGGVMDVEACAKFPWLRDLERTCTRLTTCPRDAGLLELLALLSARPGFELGFGLVGKSPKH